VTLRAAHQCAGNPLEPTKPARTIANVEWRGVLLRDILQRVEVSPTCRYIWAYGQDCGSFYGSPYQEHYVKDLPVDYVMQEDVLVATHLDGEPLPLKHGFPARVVAPGYYGTNSVKWLCRLEAAERRANGYFTNELYNDPAADGVGTKPVWLTR
jgi:DMSO/TMAO reductase YedYZ molybdopterin-dependent catalytic subunit